jgi:hypothetical protein
MVARASAGVGNGMVVIAQSRVPYTLQSVAGAADAVYTVLKPVVLPAGTMGPNSDLVIETDWDILTTGAKYMGIDFGGTNMGGATNISGGTITISCRTVISNMNSLNSQTAFNSTSYGVQSIARATASIDTSAAVTIDFKAKWSLAQGDALQTIILRGYSIVHRPGV